MKIQPVDLRVLIELDPTEAKTAGGIIIPQTQKDREQMAEVRGTLIAIGENAFAEMQDPPKIGDRVMIARYAGTEVKDSDPIQRICNDEDIIAVIN